MGKSLKQFRYVYDKTKPGGVEISPQAFNEIQSNKENKIYVISLYIQTLPGVTININGQSVKIGITGVYELEQKAGMIISNISMDESSLNLIRNNADAYLIFNAIYKEG